MRITKISHPLPGFYRVDTLVKRLCDENGQDDFYADEFLRRARGAIIAGELQSRYPETGYPIDNKNDVTPIVTMLDFNGWLGSWQCPFSLVEPNLPTVATNPNPSCLDTKPQARDDAPVDATTAAPPKQAGTALAPVVKVQASEPRPAATSPRFTMTKAAMIAQHEHEWHTIKRDMADAKRNGLSAAAKEGARGWREADAMEWARANNRLQKSPIQEVTTVASTMPTVKTLPSRRIKGC